MYCLENKKETSRLEEQNAHSIYSINDELSQVNFSNVKTVFDAGCGSGYVTRSILDLFPDLEITGMDFGEDRLSDARVLAEKEGKKAQFVHGNLNSINMSSNSFDLVISRFVFHHLDHHQKVMDELFRITKPGGRVAIIDSDGIMFNFYSNNMELMKLINRLENSFKLDFFVARKMKSFMANSGLSNLESSVVPMHFTKTSLIFEKEQYEQRFSFMKPQIAELIGEKDAERFCQLYLDALDDVDGKKGTELFYNRFITIGHKA